MEIGKLKDPYFRNKMASLIYNKAGALEGIQPGVADDAIYAGQRVPYLTGSQLQRYAAIIYAESTYLGLLRQIHPVQPIVEMEREAFAMAVTMYQYARSKSAAFQRAQRFYGLQDLLNDSGYTKGINSPILQEYYGEAGDEQRRRSATLAVIRLFTRQFWGFESVVEAVQGALYWDGNDLFRRYKDHYRAKKGFELGHSDHGRLYQEVTSLEGVQVIQSCPATDPAVAVLRTYTFRSCATFGGSIFFQLHPQALEQGISW